MFCNSPRLFQSPARNLTLLLVSTLIVVALVSAGALMFTLRSIIVQVAPPAVATTCRTTCRRSTSSRRSCATSTRTTCPGAGTPSIPAPCVLPT